MKRLRYALAEFIDQNALVVYAVVTLAVLVTVLLFAMRVAVSQPASYYVVVIGTRFGTPVISAQPVVAVKPIRSFNDVTEVAAQIAKSNNMSDVQVLSWRTY